MVEEKAQTSQTSVDVDSLLVALNVDDLTAIKQKLDELKEKLKDKKFVWEGKKIVFNFTSSCTCNEFSAVIKMIYKMLNKLETLNKIIELTELAEELGALRTFVGSSVENYNCSIECEYIVDKCKYANTVTSKPFSTVTFENGKLFVCKDTVNELGINIDNYDSYTALLKELRQKQVDELVKQIKILAEALKYTE